MGAVRLKLFADLRRRRLQSIAIALVLCLSTAAGTLAVEVLVESHAPFDRAFAVAGGAHLVIDYGASVAASRLAATAKVTVVTASAGPWPVTRAALGDPKGGLVGGLELSGRTQPEVGVDIVTPTAGRWWQADGEAVVDQATARMLGLTVGDTITVHPEPSGSKGGPGVQAEPGGGPPVGPAAPPTESGVTLKVVGIAGSVSTPDVAVWTSPATIRTLAGQPGPEQEMLYRVDPSATPADLAAAVSSITAGLPNDAVVGTVSYLDTKHGVDRLADLYVPVLLAFSLFALLAAAFSITNVISGIVLTGRREIGVMKAIGFVPGQVTQVLVGQVLAPVVVGALAGAALGAIGSLPALADTAESFGLPAIALVSLPVALAVAVVAIGIASVAAIGPAIRGGRLSPVDAMAGDAASAGPLAKALRRLGLRLPGPLPVRLGVSTAVAHPARAAMTLGALVVGVTAATFSVGLNASLLKVNDQLGRSSASPIRVELADGDPEAVSALVEARPDTAHTVAVGEGTVTVPGVGGVAFVGYRGDATWIGYELVSGRWFAGPGEAVAPTNFYTVSGLHLGDTTTLRVSGRSVIVRLVGETFETAQEAADDLVVRGAWADLATLVPSVEPDRWEIQPTAGVDIHDYWSSLQTALGSQAQAFVESRGRIDESFLLFLSVIGVLGVVLTAISLGGVFNTVLLETRQRTRELAILKAIGLTPGQVTAMVIASIVPLGLVAGLIGVPTGIVAQHLVLTYMGQVAAKTGVPASTFDVFGPLALLGLGLAGLAIGAAGAYLPALRAARARIAPVLQAE